MKKYVKDYRVDYELTARGRLKGRAVYAGDRFRPALDDEALRPVKLRLGILLGLSVLLLLALLWFTTLLQEAFSLLAIPMALCVLTLWMMGRALWLLCRAEMPTTRSRSDRISSHYAAASLFQMALSALSFLGVTAQIPVLGFSVPRLLYVLAALALAVCGVLLFLQRDKLKMEKAEPEQTDIFGE